MRIFDYDKYCKVGGCLDWAKGCKNHRVERGFTIGDNGQSKSICSAWESEVPDFMVGDRVVIKTWKQMKTEYGIDVLGSINCKCKFLKVMRNLCGKKATITDKYKEMISLTFDDINADNGWNFSTDMIELAYPTVRGNDKEKRVETSKVTYTSNTVEYNGQEATCQLGDKFDLEKGIMLCLLKEKGIGYREIQELANTAERKINHKFNVGDVVKVINNGTIFPLYEKWFDDNDFLILKPFFAKDKQIANGKELKVRAYSEGGLPTTMIYACEDLKGDIYLIGERGLKKVED